MSKSKSKLPKRGKLRHSHSRQKTLIRWLKVPLLQVQRRHRLRKISKPKLRPRQSGRRQSESGPRRHGQRLFRRRSRPRKLRKTGKLNRSYKTSRKQLGESKLRRHLLIGSKLTDKLLRLQLKQQLLKRLS